MLIMFTQRRIYMNESNLKLAQKEIDDALKAVDEMVDVLDSDNPKSLLKEKFTVLTSKVQELEIILKNEGII